MIVQVQIGRGGWSFTRELELPAVPHEGDYVGPSGDVVFPVTSAPTITPSRVYVRCGVSFGSAADAEDAAKAWDAALAPAPEAGQ